MASPSQPQSILQTDAAKARLRERCKAEREQVPPDVRERLAARVAEFGIGFAGPAHGAIVSAYRAIGAELDPAALLAQLTVQGFGTCLPVLQGRGRPLLFRAWRPGDPLEPGTWGIEQPIAAAEAVEPDVVLLPLLAFDARGGRLGHGGGFYDRTLARLRALKPVVAIGLAFDGQEVGEVPAGPHDERLDWVLTPRGPRQCSG